MLNEGATWSILFHAIVMIKISRIKVMIFYKLLVFGHRSLIKNIKQTCILWTWHFVCESTDIFKSKTVNFIFKAICSV